LIPFDDHVGRRQASVLKRLEAEPILSLTYHGEVSLGLRQEEETEVDPIV
jgi:hypothetical protein